MKERLNIGKKDAQTNEIESKAIFLKPEWFKAYYEGNSLIPQTGDGFVTYTMVSTILDDPKTDWNEFFNSKFSQDQLVFLGNAMSAMHSRKKVNISTERNVHLFEGGPKVIPEEKIQTLWKGAKDYLMLILLSYINSEYYDSTKLQPYMSNNENNINTIKSFFNNKNNFQQISELKTALGVIKKTIKEKEIVDLLKKYREEFNEPIKHKKNLWEKYYGDKFREILDKKVTESFNGTLPLHLKNLYLFNNLDN